MGWYIYRVTNSSYYLGLMAFAANIPTFFITSFAGVAADRYNRHKIIMATQFLALIQAFCLFILVYMFPPDIFYLVGLSLFQGFINAFDAPARQAFVYDLIEDKSDLGNAIALNSGIFNSARLIGPSIAAFVIYQAGEAACFFINALSYAAILFALSLMKINYKPKVIKKENVFANLKEGFAYAYNFYPIRSILMLVSIIGVLGMSYVVILPVFARDILKGGPDMLGYLMGAVGIGAICGAAYLASKKDPANVYKLIPRSIFIASFSLMVFALSVNKFFSLLCLIGTGFGMMSGIAACNTTIQAISDEDKRGRVIGIYVMSFIGMAPFGSFVVGSASHYYGAPMTIFWCGMFCIAGAGSFFLKLPKIQNEIKAAFDRKSLINGKENAAAAIK